MKKKFISAGLLIAVAIVLAAPGCKKAASSDPDETPDPFGAPCGPKQELRGYKPVWTYYNCGPMDTLYIDTETKDSFTGVPLGDLPVAKGKLSLRYHDLLNDNFQSRETFGIYFQAGGRAHDWEVNWQWMSYYLGAGFILSRLTIQRFDGTCDPRPFCEHSVISEGLQFWDYKDVYQWDCEWDTPQYHLQCFITKVGDPDFRIDVLQDPLGPYNKLHYIGVGRQAYRKLTYDGYPGYVSDLKLTIYE